MTLQQLKYISMVEKCGSFSKAAQKLYVSQPSVSSLVHALEEELGITVFTRSSSGIAITNEGRQLLKLSNKLLRDARTTLTSTSSAAPRGRSRRFSSAASTMTSL